MFGNALEMRTRGVPRILMECRESELMECHEFHFSLAWCFTVFAAYALAWLKSHPCSQLTVCHCASFHPPCHLCPPDAHATLAGLDYTRVRLGEISTNMAAELTLGGTA